MRPFGRPQHPSDQGFDPAILEINGAQFSGRINAATGDGFRLLLGQIRAATGVDEAGRIRVAESYFGPRIESD